MPTPQFYRAEAERLCAGAVNAAPAEAARWRQLAAEYDLLADSMEGPRVAPQMQRGPIQQQVQQQLGKSQGDDRNDP
jgi:hypothetical protein